MDLLLLRPTRPAPSPAHGRLRSTGVVLLAALLFSTAARPAAGDRPCGHTPKPEVVVERVNAVRARGTVCATGEGAGTAASPLRWNGELAAAAAAQAHDMAVRGRMEHRDGDHRDLTERLVASGYRFRSAAENLAFGYESPDDVVEAWILSRAHCAALMDNELLEFGLACSDSGITSIPGEGRYWTMVLGTPLRSR